ncbi:MAG: hypothetical protein IPG32_17475 [Saprospirales bacterium]|nr:hypothetical protein [Saprospirales bacterium]
MMHNTGNAAAARKLDHKRQSLFTIGIGRLHTCQSYPDRDVGDLTVTFMPTAAGVQNATITINNNDCDEAVYDFAVTGTGLEPAKALHFDGTGPSDNVNSPAITAFGTQPVTIEFWAKNQSSFTFPVGFANSYLFMFNSGTFVIPGILWATTTPAPASAIRARYGNICPDL